MDGRRGSIGRQGCEASYLTQRYQPDLRLDDISDYMRRDIGIVDGRPTICGNGFAETDARSRGFDRLAQTRFAS
jgi:hypothetical protein